MSKSRTKIKKLSKCNRDMGRAYRRATEHNAELASAIHDFLSPEEYQRFVRFFNQR